MFNKLSLLPLMNALGMTLIVAGYASAQSQSAQPAGRPDDPRINYTVPDDVSVRKVDIYSDGIRLAGYVYAPRSAGVNQKLPTIVAAHGWGGVQMLIRRDASEFAQAGYMVVTFDYRGWGESDSQVILTQPEKKVDDIKFTAEVRALRELVDPVGMTADWLNAIHWVHGEPQCDTDRIGLWGSSMGGGYVVYAAAHDPRVKAVHSQIAGLSSRGLAYTPAARAEATKLARGEASYPEPGARTQGSLRGAPVRGKFATYTPIDDFVEQDKVPLQLVLAGDEELVDNKTNGILLYERYQGPKNLVIVPGVDHYGMYRKEYFRAHKLAQEWFDKYLKK